ncbi:MAG: hypothetical protein AAF911_07470 [Planctomycetota bacterium]
MVRFLLIFTLVCTGLAPSAICLQAAASAGTPVVVVEDCAMSCCGLTCCCVTQSTPATPAPEAPATPPRGADSVPTVLLLASPYELAWGEAPTHPRLEAAVDSDAWSSPRAVQPMICRWLT